MEGDFSEICYNAEYSWMLAEFVGLLSGQKKIAAMELKSLTDANKLKRILKKYDPLGNYNYLITPAYDWIKKVNPEYRLNLFIGKNADLKDFERYYKQPQKHSIEVNQKIGEGLSYPKCCTYAVNFNKPFTYYFKAGEVNKIDYRINNLYLRSGSNAILIRHYVCNYSCRKSIRYSIKVLSFLKKKFPEIYEFYLRVLKMPVMMVAAHRLPGRIVGDSVIYTFEGSFVAKTLRYSKVYYHGKQPGTQYLNKEEGEQIFRQLLKGNELKLTKYGADIYKYGECKDSIFNDRLIFIKPY
ncbi:MAG: hypothetical protein QXK37_04400 [Candidatus Woesearchaeota archaeon]